MNKTGVFKTNMNADCNLFFYKMAYILFGLTYSYNISQKNWIVD